MICDALDAIGKRNQSPAIDLLPMTGTEKLYGRCVTTEWEDLDAPDPKPYELELQAVDSCEAGDVMIAAASGSRRSGIWGELLSTAAWHRGCAGVIVDGAVRDVQKMTETRFPCFARYVCPLDSQHRQRVKAVGCAVEVGGVLVENGDFVFADRDGVVFVPYAVKHEVVAYATNKVSEENVTRDAIMAGMSATQAYERYGVL